MSSDDGKDNVRVFSLRGVKVVRPPKNAGASEKSDATTQQADAPPAEDGQPVSAGIAALEQLAQQFEEPTNAQAHDVSDEPFHSAEESEGQPDWLTTGAPIDTSPPSDSPPTSPSPQPPSVAPTPAQRPHLFARKITQAPAVMPAPTSKAAPTAADPEQPEQASVSAPTAPKKASWSLFGKKPAPQAPAAAPAGSNAVQKNRFPMYVAAFVLLLVVAVSVAIVKQDQSNQEVALKLKEARDLAVKSAADNLAKANRPPDVATGAPSLASFETPAAPAVEPLPESGEQRYLRMLAQIEGESKPAPAGPVVQPPSRTPAPQPVAQVAPPVAEPLNDVPAKVVPAEIEGRAAEPAKTEQATSFAAFGEVVAVSNLPYVLLEVRQTAASAQALIGHLQTRQATWLGQGAHTSDGYTVVKVEPSHVILLTPQNRPVRLTRYTP